MTQPSEFGQFLKQKRHEANLTQDDLAVAIKKTGQYISNIEKGKNSAPPNDSDIEALIERLGINENDAQRFREKAAADRMRLPNDQMEYLFKHRKLLDLLYYGQINNFDDEMWEKILTTVSGGE